MTPIRSRREQRPTEDHTVLLVTDAARPGGFVVSKRTPWDGLAARMHALRLDEELASGLPPDEDRLRAVRASMIVAPQWREKLARYWEALVDRAMRATGVGDPHVPFPRARILAAEDDIHELAAALRARLPLPARGLAVANQLLTDGTGPVYRLASTRDLRTEIRDAVQYLDPRAVLMTPQFDV